MNTTLLIFRVAVLAALIGASFIDWQRGKLQDAALQAKDVLIADLQSLSLLNATENIILRANHAGEEGVFIIHVPSDGCPPGWESLPRYFTKRDGSTRDACAIRRGQSITTHMDYLDVGESAQVSTEPISPSLVPNDKLGQFRPKPPNAN